MLSISNKELWETLENFHNVTGLKIVMYDSDRNIIATYPEKFEPYCKRVRTAVELSLKCIACDNKGFDICERTRLPYIYKCHMNITEAIAPIITNSVIIGYLMFGQVLCLEDAKTARECAVMTADKFGFDKNVFLEDLESMKQATRDYLLSALKIMSMCAGYLYANKIIKHSADILAYQLKEYIGTHLSDVLSANSLCKTFYISRSKLYQTSINEFGIGIMDYIRKERLNQAKKKLTDTTLSINQIAREVGICDTNYFTRAFKKNIGLTPTEYREKIKR